MSAKMESSLIAEENLDDGFDEPIQSGENEKSSKLEQVFTPPRASSLASSSLPYTPNTHFPKAVSVAVPNTPYSPSTAFQSRLKRTIDDIESKNDAELANLSGASMTLLLELLKKADKNSRDLKKTEAIEIERGMSLNIFSRDQRKPDEIVLSRIRLQRSRLNALNAVKAEASASNSN
eukprot:TRINITY_DN7273_c0_g1_i1.p1 TRINITY_DN7273_c0_g1~~TRINITY_DN7273_c0_g1_i1.p1  ORF type:complete len:178 (+),score=66.82 TRINITY_DN7273_c0_g1_i1:94-627(+)